MTYPKWALKHKMKGTAIHCTKGVKGDYYYLYEVTSKWDKKKKRSSKITGKYLGRITEEDGFVPKGQRGSKEKPKKAPKVLEYGATHTLINLSEDIIQHLNKHFPKDGETVYALALLKLIYKKPFKNMEDLFGSSYLSVHYKDLKLYHNKITTTLRSLGKQDEAIYAFQRNYLKDVKHVAYDLSHIISKSTKMGMNHQGYNSMRDYDPQVNTLYLFSTDIKMPAFYRVLPGNISGVKALKLTIDEAGLQDCTAVGDKGFFSNSNILKLEKEGIRYILPVRRNSKYVNYSRLKSRDYSEAYDGHFMHKKRTIYYYSYQHNGRNCIMFHDPKLQQEEVNSYFLRIEEKKRGYTIANFKKRQLTLGTFLVITNIENPEPKEVYKQYKERMEIETMFKALKNSLDADVSYMQSDESFKAWMFINHISLMLYYRLYNLLAKEDLLKKHSPGDILMKLSQIYKVRIKNSWQLSEVTTKTQKLVKKLGLTIT